MCKMDTPHTVQLTEDGRARLDEFARQHYTMRAAGNHDRARELRLAFTNGAGAIGAGAGRFVYSLPADRYTGFTGECVVKLAVPNDRHRGWNGKAQNRHETATWEETNSSYLMPVFAADADGYWLVMPHGQPTDDEPAVGAWLNDASAALCDRIARSELTEKNVVRFDGTFRLCDYGVPPPGKR